MGFVRPRSLYAKVYVSLIGAMLSGRVFFGILNALLFSAGSYSVNIWLTAAFITALPGIAVQILIVPAVVVVLRQAKLAEI